MGIWIKIFQDNTKEYGSDKDIANKLASWSRGRLNGIKEVRLLDTRTTCSLTVENTNWHQFDRFEAQLNIGQAVDPIRIFRAVQAELQDQHVGRILVCSRSDVHFYCALIQDLTLPNTGYFFYKPITENHIGKWLTMILPAKDYPYISFMDRGTINGGQRISR